MKIVFKTSQVKSLFGMISSCISEEKIAVTHNMYIKKIDDNVVYVRAMDSKHVLEKNIPFVESENFTEAYIPFFEISKFVCKFKNEETKFQFKENDILRVSSGKSYCQVSLKNAQESDSVVTMLNAQFMDEIIVNKTVIQNIKNKLSGLVAADNNRPVLNGVCLDIFQNNLYFAASDGKKLSVYNTQVVVDQTECLRVVIPIDAISGFCSVCENEQVSIYRNDKYIKLQSGDTKYYSTLVNGEYPDYRRILNSTNNNNVVVNVNKSNLCDALSFVNVNFQVNKKCDLTIKEGKFALNFNNNESFEQFDVESEQNFEVSINSQYLEKMVKPLNAQQIVFKFLNKEAPILIQADSIKMMLMPLRSR